MEVKKYFFFSAAFCWMVAVVIHGFCIAGVNVGEWFKGVWIMHMGIFPVWFYAIWQLKQNPELSDFSLRDALGRRKSPITFFKILTRGIPVWMLVLAIACFYYAPINFFLALNAMGGTPAIKDGQYILHNHGTLVKTLTLQEYNYACAQELRLFSGHWIAFYGIAAALLFPSAQQQPK